MMKSNVLENINGIIVKVKNERYMIEVNYIKEIFIPGEKIIPIPLSDKSIVGIIDIRGIIYTILSLRHVVNSNETEYGFNKETRVLLIESEGMNLGLLVDSVIGVSEVPLSIFEEKSSIIETSLDWEYIKSIGVLNDKSIILLDLNKLLTKHEPIGEEKEDTPVSEIPSSTNIKPVASVKVKVPEPVFKDKEVKKTSPPDSEKKPSPKTIPKVTSSKFGKRSTTKPETKPSKPEELIKITESQKDMLREVGNIGTGNAVTALSNMINKRIDVELTDVDIIKNNSMTSQFGGEEEFVCGIFSHIEKPSQSTLLQVFDMKPLLKLIQSLEGMEKKKFGDVKSKEDLDDFTISTIREVGNILAGHYSSALADLMNTKLVPYVPDFAMMKAGDLSEFLSKELKSISDFIIMIKTIVKIVDLSITGIFFFIPDYDALQDLFKILGIEEEELEDSEQKKKVNEKKNELKLTKQQIDALKEVGNIGSGNAASALAKMINQRVDIDIPDVDLVKVEDFATTWSKINENLFLCWSNVSGLTNATVITIFKINEIMDIISLIVGEKPEIDSKKIKSFDDIPELFQSAMSEVGHILGSHYTNALGNLLNTKLMIDPPDVNIDSGKKLVKILKDDLGLIKELSLVITTQIIIKEKKIQGSFLFIPDFEKIKSLFDALSALYEGL